MTTLMVFLAGLTMGSDGTERISTGAHQHFLGNGYWEGVLKAVFVEGPKTSEARLEPCQFMITEGGVVTRSMNCSWIDEGRGKCRLLFNSESIRDGIYK
jgi:hypothetical protein